MEPWVYLVVATILAVVTGTVKLIAFRMEIKLRREVEQLDYNLIDGAQLMGNAEDVAAMGLARARTVKARGQLPRFKMELGKLAGMFTCHQKATGSAPDGDNTSKASPP